ncbi:diguanylate cyclase [Sulfuricaulis limicola]|uniref:Diguanylate cyclase n=1 Tax=Sulfuricaulis limicola TaxID=1620215 RepID=A0A1B4XIM2_9GAMM|nr:sensor domain-containing diguanylate cyclase [Sulfuricaulis limicola]BAV34650.1 diguanylate cyclase [Sulfuricaulis limicola]
MIGNPATVSGRVSRITITTIGVALILLGISVILGWLLKIAPLLQVVPGFAAMVFNTALCFALAGTALLLPERATWRRRAQTTIGIIIASLSALILAQDIFGVDLAIDHLFSAEWLHDYRPHPTRMAPNTAVALILGGISLVLLPVRARWANHLTLILTLLVAVIGGTALVGYLFNLELLFTWYPYARMALHTAIATVALAIGLGLKALQQPHFQELFGAGQDKRIVFSGSVILVTIALVSGLASFVVLERQIEVMLRNELELLLRNRVDVFHNTINQGILATEAIATRPAIQRELQRLHAAPNDPGAIKFLRQAIGSFLPLGFSAVILNDRHGRELVHAGTLIQQPETRLRLNTPQHAELLWDNGLTLRLQIPIRDPGGPSGTVIAERPLPLLTLLFHDIRGLGETGEMAVCAAHGDNILCLPTRLNPRVFSVPRRIQGTSLPMSHALDGDTGVITASDYRGQQVIAAHSPIPQLGLGMVLKMDASELYGPLHQKIQRVALLLLILVTFGILLLHWQVMPLARRLVESERRTRESEQRWNFALEGSQNGVWDWDMETNAVFFSRRWKEMLGYAEHEISGKLEEWDKRVHPEDKARVHADIEKHMQGKAAHYQNEHRVLCKDGTYKWVLDRGMIVSRDASGKPVRMIGTHTDITERKRAEETIRELSLTDELTGLRNRRGFLTLAQMEMALIRRTKRQMALFYIDLDGMKKINDSFGHSVGDLALQDVAQILRQTFRESDIICRLGGDEFAVLALETTGRPREQIVKRLQAKIDSHNHTANRQYTIAVSVGMIHVDSGSTITLEELMAQADTEMYQAKQKRGAQRKN